MIYAIHEHELKPGADATRYQQDVAAAIARMNIPGLRFACHLQGLRGARENRYAVLWVFESEAALTENFGTPDQRRWPPDWEHYENDVLAHYLDRHPDAITYTDYRRLQGFDFPGESVKI